MPVMSELSTVQCDRALGLWIAGIRASSVDGELPWRSSGWAAVVAFIPPLIEDMYRAVADPTGLTGPLDWSDRSSRSSWVFKSPSPVRGG